MIFFEFLGGVSKNFGWFLGFLSFLGGVSNACELGDSRSKLDVGCRAPMEDGVRGWACFPKTIKYKCF